MNEKNLAAVNAQKEVLEHHKIHGYTPRCIDARRNVTDIFTSYINNLTMDTPREPGDTDQEIKEKIYEFMLMKLEYQRIAYWHYQAVEPPSLEDLIQHEITADPFLKDILQ